MISSFRAQNECMGYIIYISRPLDREVIFFSKDGKGIYLLGDFDREQISVIDYISLYDVKSDGINRYEHHILEQKKKESKKSFEPTTRRNERERERVRGVGQTLYVSC